MNKYFEIKAIPDPELVQSAVVSHLMQCLHSYLPNYESRIGLGFPGYGQQRTLGGIIRVLGTAEDLNLLIQQLKADNKSSSYSLLTDILDIPKNIKLHAIYSRKHAKGNSDFERLRRRHIERQTWTDELEKKSLEKYSQPIHLPHVYLRSGSTQQAKFPMFIKREMTPTSKTCSFNAYGLSLEGATIPVF